MTITHEQLAGRIRVAREATGFTQDEVAQVLGVSRSSVAQIEAGNRKVSSIELMKLASLVGRLMRDFFDEEFAPDGAAVLLRALPEVAQDVTTRTAITGAIELARTILSLEGILGRNAVRPAIPHYDVGTPRARWEAVAKGREIAERERERLRLGSAPIADLPAALEATGVVVLELELPRQVSGFTARVDKATVCGVNVVHRETRQHFSLSHEYCHALCDISQALGIVTYAGQEKAPQETRADVFAASFLMPDEGVRAALTRLGKGSPSRPSEAVFSGVELSKVEIVEGRMPPGSQELDGCDVVLLAEHFRVSREAMIWRLFNLDVLGVPRRDRLIEMDRDGALARIASHLGLKTPPETTSEARPRAFRQLLALAHEAMQREEITRSRFQELARMARLDEDGIDDFLAS